MKWISIFLICGLLIGAVIVGQAAAETINIDYSDQGSYESGERTQYQVAYSAMSGTQMRFLCQDIESFANIRSIIWNLDAPVLWTVYNSSKVTTSTNVVYEISGAEVGTGELQFSYLTDSESNKYGVLLALFDDGLDLGTISGTQLLNCVYDAEELNIKQSSDAYTSKITDNYDTPYYMVPTFYTGTNPSFARTINAKDGIIYYGADLSQTLTYGYNADDTLYISYNRGGISNAISVIGDSGDGVPAYEYYDNVDFYLSPLYQSPYEVFIDNPFTTGYVEGTDRWTYIIPDEEEEEDQDTVTGSYYIYDAATGYLMNTINCVVNTTPAGGSVSDEYGTVPYEVEFGGGSWESVYFYKDGYANSTTYTYYSTPWAPQTGWSWMPSSDFTTSVYLTPTELPSEGEVTVVFHVMQEVSYPGSDFYWNSEGAAVTCNGITRSTPSSGMVSFTLDNATAYTYTASKTSYESVSGSFTTGDANELIEIELPYPPSSATPTVSPGTTQTYIPGYSDVDLDEAGESFLWTLLGNGNLEGLASLFFLALFVGVLKLIVK